MFQALNNASGMVADLTHAGIGNGWVFMEPCLLEYYYITEFV